MNANLTRKPLYRQFPHENYYEIFHAKNDTITKFSFKSLTLNISLKILRKYLIKKEKSEPKFYYLNNIS